MNEETIFSQAAIPPGERSEFLDRVCQGDDRLRARIEALLTAHDNPDEFLNAPEVAATEASPRISEGPGDQIGKFKLLQQIGEGGMGVVYMAEQREPVRRKVALKIIKPGMDTRQVIARFEAERQALEMMDHPNIAKVLDAGTTDSGRPYFAMELVNGIPITEFCDEQQLSTEERLDLFASVCHAVQHAHQKGIIHRDLKPSNILVAMYDGKVVPKVIDFGVAKATNQSLTERTLFTQFGQIVGTLEYMSPEQAQRNQLDIDTRSDIYSLGVVLYELLTGETPFERKRLRSAAFDELLRIIREEEPPKPSIKLRSSQSLPAVAANRRIQPLKLPTLVRGELDWIVMTAINKDRGQRYETANAFAADVRRYLDDEPVLACPPSAVYRLRKIVSRYKVMISSVAVLILALVLGLVGTTWQARRAKNAENELLATVDTLEETVGTLKETVGRLRNSLIQEGFSLAMVGRTAEASEIADDLEQIDHVEASQAAAKLRILISIQDGKLEQAEKLVESAISENPNSIGLKALRAFVHDAAGNFLEFQSAAQDVDLADANTAQPEDYLLLTKIGKDIAFTRKMAAMACHTWNSPIAFLIRGRTEADHVNLTGETQGAEAAIQDIEAASHLLPPSSLVRIESLAAYLLIANTYRANGDDDAFEHYFRAAGIAADEIAQQDDPALWELLYLAEYYCECGGDDGLQRAVDCFQRAIDTYDDDVTMVFYGSLLAELSVDSRSLDLVQATGLPSRGPISDGATAMLNLLTGNMDIAVQQAEKAIAEYELPDANILGLSVLHMAGKTDRAETLARNALARSRNTRADVRAGWPLNHVIAYFGDEKLRSSLLENAQDSECEHFALMYTHWAIGCRALGNGDIQKATEHFRTCTHQGMINCGYPQWARAMIKILEKNSWPPAE